MHTFLQQHLKSVTGMISGWDRLRFHGTLISICHAEGLSRFLSASGKFFKGFKDFALSSSQALKAAALRVAQEANRPVQYLSDPGVSKEQVARICAKQDGIKEGLICTLTAVEPCWSFEFMKDPASGRIDFRRAYRKGLHIYHYYQHPVFGFMHVRLQTWIPFEQYICINGREWLARQMDAAQIGYLRKENCFIHIDDVPAAQAMMDEQVCFNWRPALDELAQSIAPTLQQVLAPYQVSYYWTIQESEWATDIMFKSHWELSRLYLGLIYHGMQSFGSREVMRFLGQKVPLHARSGGEGIHGNDRRAVITDLKQRPEGLRIRHRLGSNSIKMYNKQGSVLRVETTLNNVSELKSPRRQEGKVLWKRMRKGIADARQRAAVSQAANQRYLEALAVVDTPITLKSLTELLARPLRWGKQRIRGLNLLGEHDAKLLETVGKAEFLIHGLRNRDLQSVFFGDSTDDPKEKRRRSAQIGRKLRMLRAHGLLCKLAHTHRYMVSEKGRQVITALIAARQADIAKLAQAA
jgi:hypothetical protein